MKKIFHVFMLAAFLMVSFSFPASVSLFFGFSEAVTLAQELE